MADLRRGGAERWRDGAETEELREIARIDKRLGALDDERRELAAERNRITNRCLQRVKRDAVA